jgi:hypothetical protein
VPPFWAGAYGYWDDHVLARLAIWNKADYLTERCGNLVDSLPGISTFFLYRSQTDRAIAG